MRKITFLLILLILLGGCNSDDGGSLSLFGAEPTQLDSSSVESVVSAFLNAWRDQDYPAMYRLITPTARQTISQEDFTAIYEVVVELLGLRGLTWQSTASPTIQGTSAFIDYSVTFDTSKLGVFSDPNPDFETPDGRKMWLVIVPEEGWRIAWSRMDIFPGWTNSSRLRLVPTMPSRGSIYDRNGQILVNSRGTPVTIFVAQNQMPSRDACAVELSRILRMEYDDILTTFDLYSIETEFAIGEISEETYNLENNNLVRACNYREYKRPNPIRHYYERVAAHLIGYVGQIPAERQAEYRAAGYPDDALVGLSGIEATFEEELRGIIGVRLTIEATSGVSIRTIASRSPQPGRNIQLTIDRNLQLGIQSILARAYDIAEPTWVPTSRGGSVVVMNINTGEILAIASYPDFDPGVFNPDTLVFNPAAQIQRYSTDIRTPLLNRATNGRYPLGSVFKVFSMITALDSGVWNTTNTNTCTGSWDGTVFNDQERTDWKLDGHGTLDMKGALVNSCNPYFWQMSVALNTNDPYLLPSYSVRMGFGQTPPFQGIPVDSGFIPDPEWADRERGSAWAQPDASNLVIGQGDMTVTPLQVVRATAMVANNGTLYDPIVIKRIEGAGQIPATIYETKGQTIGLSTAVLSFTREAMCDVTLVPVVGSQGGTANFIFQEWYEHNNYQVLVCGKTGTAQSGDNSAPHAWFTAYAPMDNPEIAIIAMVENSCEGSEVAAPIVRQVLEVYFPQLDPNFGTPPLWVDGCTPIGPGTPG